MLEKDIENLIAQHPEDIFPGEGFVLIGQQYPIKGKRIDILFQDKQKRKIIVEVKRGILNREASGQIAEYYGLLKSINQDEFFEMILCANIIPKERRLFLENIGIECKELGISFISEIAKKYDYTFLDDRPTKEHYNSLNNIDIDQISELESEISVWIFQANPNRYDILNALSDDKIGNKIHWLVNQHKNKIHKNHIGLIWMSGTDAGIYALTRIESEPGLMKEYPPERKYWYDSSEKEESIRVKMTIINKLTNKPILKRDLKNIKGLEYLSIFKQYQGTNFPVSQKEWNIISRLF